MARFIRVSKSDEFRTANGDPLPFTKKTWYKLHHLQRYPEIFSKIGRTLLIDIDGIDNLMEQERLVKRLSTRSLKR